MLTITVEDTETFNDMTQEFVTIPGTTIRLEHSLVALSKWEMEWERPFLTDEKRTRKEMMSYISCMIIDDDVDTSVVYRMTNSQIKEVAEYIEKKMTATTITERRPPQEGARVKKEIITSELLYYYMTAQNIPMECQHWHLSRLIMLIRVAAIRNKPPEKMDKKTSAEHARAINQANRKRLGTKG